MNGQADAQKELDLQSDSVEVPKKAKISEFTLQHDFTTLTMATAARKSKRTLLESICLQNLCYIATVAETSNIALNDMVDSHDVAEVMLSILDEVKS